MTQKTVASLRSNIVQRAQFDMTSEFTFTLKHRLRIIKQHTLGKFQRYVTCIDKDTTNAAVGVVRF
nr:hypothetical protein [Roseobacter sp. CCS2]